MTAQRHMGSKIQKFLNLTLAVVADKPLPHSWFNTVYKKRKGMVSICYGKNEWPWWNGYQRSCTLLTGKASVFSNGAFIWELINKGSWYLPLLTMVTEFLCMSPLPCTGDVAQASLFANHTVHSGCANVWLTSNLELPLPHFSHHARLGHHLNTEVRVRQTSSITSLKEISLQKFLLHLTKNFRNT